MPDSPYYKPHQLEELQQGYSTVNPAYERLMDEYLSLRLTNEAAYEYVRHGFIRRLGTLKRCIENVYSIYPPERSDKPTRDECLDLDINLQSFMFNVFGGIDNLAWIWVKERRPKDNRGRPLRDQHVGLRSRRVPVLLRADFFGRRGIKPRRLQRLVVSRGTRWFESGFLQRGVWCEPDFRVRIPSTAVGDYRPVPRGG
jgi:hypothetical protein